MVKTFNVLLWALLTVIFVTLIINFAEGLRYFAFNEASAGSLGIVFFILAFAGFIMEMMTPGFGLFTAVGIVALTIGSILLFRIEPWLIILIDTVIGVASYFVIVRVVKAQRHPVRTGREEMPGKTATVRQTLDPKGLVFYDGELWTAVSDSGVISVGEDVTIERVNGVVLRVTREKEGGKQCRLS